MLPSVVVVEEYLDDHGESPFATWFGDLDPRAAAKVAVAIARIERGAVSNVKGAGEGVLKFRIDFGPGYRVYFGRDGDRFVILLAGGTKRRQDKDIADATARWKNYKARKARAPNESGS